MTEKKKIPLFWQCYIIIFAMLFIIIIAGLVIFWSYIDAYEKSLPSHTIDSFIISEKENFYNTVDYLYADINTPFDDKNAVIKAIADELEGDRVFKYKAEEQSDNLKYRVFFNDGTPFCSLTLKKDKDVGFGFSTWSVADKNYEIGENLLPVKNILPYSALTVHAPEGSSVTIGSGHSVASDEREFFNTKSVFNHITESECQITAYIAEPVYITSEVEITYPDGSTASYNFNHSQSLDAYSNYFSAMLHEYNITVPENYLLFISDVQVDKKYITAKDIPYTAGNNIACQINAAADNTPQLVRYTVADILLSPEVTVENPDGKIITLNGTDGVFEYSTTDNNGALMITVSIPDKATLTLNGITVGAESVNDNFYADDVKNVTAYADVPMMTQYVVAGLNSIPKIQVTDMNGVLLPVSEENGMYIAYPADNGKLSEVFSQTAVNFTNDFLNFTAGGYENTDANFEPVAAQLLSGSDASKLMYAAKFSFGQNIPYKILSKDIILRDFRNWGENCFSVTIDMTVTLKNFRTVTDTITGMKLTYVKYNDEYKIAYIVFGKSSVEW